MKKLLLDCCQIVNYLKLKIREDKRILIEAIHEPVQINSSR